MNNLEIYIFGPKNSDVDLFLTDSILGFVQSFRYVYDTDFGISYIDLNMCSFRMVNSCVYKDSVKTNIEKDTVSIIVENFDCAPSEQKVLVSLGSDVIGLLNKIDFSVSVHFPYNELVLYPAMRSEIFNKFPSWVTIDYSKVVKEVK